MILEIKNEQLKKIAYIRVLEYAARNAEGLGLGHTDTTFGFTFAQACADLHVNRGHDTGHPGINEDWLREILPDICTARDAQGLELSNLEGRDIRDDTRFVIHSEEFIKFVNLLELEQTREVLVASQAILTEAQHNNTTATELLTEAQNNNRTASGLLQEARDSGKIAIRTFYAALATLAAAILIPFLVAWAFPPAPGSDKVHLDDAQFQTLLTEIRATAARDSAPDNRNSAIKGPSVWTRN